MNKIVKNTIIAITVLLAGAVFYLGAQVPNIFHIFTAREYAEKHYTAVSLSEFKDGFGHVRHRYKNSVPPWKLYKPTQILGIADNMLYLQNPDGGWAKNLDFQRVYSKKELVQLQIKNRLIKPVAYGFRQERTGSTLDNKNIYSQVRYLCRVYNIVKDEKGIDAQRYLEAAARGVRWILQAQHPVSGGFTGCDVYGITYNDDVMAGTLRLLRDIAGGKAPFTALPEPVRREAKTAYKRGMERILQDQITLTLPNGDRILTAWCQQYSHTPPFPPIWERNFEPPAIVSRESYEVLKLLMEEPEPDEKVKRAIRAGCDFFDRDDVRIHGKKIIKKRIAPVLLNGRTYTIDRVLVDDKTAEDLWARFYALDTGFDVTLGAPKEIKGKYPSVLQPVWCDMGCLYRDEHNAISQERRNGYDYVNAGGKGLLSEYAKWKNRINKLTLTK